MCNVNKILYYNDPDILLRGMVLAHNMPMLCTVFNIISIVCNEKL